MNFIILLTLLVVSLANEFSDDIRTVQNLLLSEGPSFQVLGEFNNVIRKIESVNKDDFELSQLYFKKSLVEINLGKEKDAISDLHRTLELDPLLTPARSKLVDLLIEFSLFDDPIFIDLNDNAVLEKITKFNQLYDQMMASMDQKDYGKCGEIINELIAISPMNASLYRNQIICLKHQETDDSRTFINAMSKLIKLEPTQDLGKYCDFSNYLLFSKVNFNKAYTNIKQCLRIDNEFKPCGDVSKILTRYTKILELLENYSIEIGYIYLNNEGDAPSIGEVNLAEKFDFDYINKFLNDKPNKRSINGLSNINTNYDYLVYLSKEVSKTLPSGDLKFHEDLHKLFCESYIHTNSFKAGSKVCDSINDEKFLPKFIPKIDGLLSKHRFSEAEQILKSFPPNTRQSDLFKSRWNQIENYNREQQAKQQQQQQQQRQQQQRQYQQQQQQQQQQQYQRSKPKNDYYKVLDVSKDADEKTIRKAYRTQTLKYHPDKYKGNDLTPDQIENKMQEINKAYEVLSDVGLKERYDRGDDPMDPAGGNSAPQQHPFGSAGQGFNFGNGGGSQYQFNFGSNDFFGSNGGFQFGGFGGGGQKVKFQKNYKKRKP